MPDEWSDDELLARLADYLRTTDPVPSHLIAAAKASIDAPPLDPDLVDVDWDAAAAELALDHGLARLVFDSALADPAALATRSAAHGRALTLVAAELTIELEISRDVLYGQLIPAAPGDVRLRTLAGEITVGRVDDVGRFTLPGAIAEPFRLRCHTDSGVRVSTVWICP